MGRAEATLLPACDLMGREGKEKAMLKYIAPVKQRHPDSPWLDLANAIVQQAAVDYRRLMERKIKHYLKMSDFERCVLDARIKEIEVFFTSDYGDLLSRGLAPLILGRLQAEFSDRLEELNRELDAQGNLQSGGSDAER